MRPQGASFRGLERRLGALILGGFERTQRRAHPPTTHPPPPPTLTRPPRPHSPTPTTPTTQALHAPIIHVNGDDAEAVVRAFELAAEWRAVWKCDVVVDMVGYRRHGHTEIDAPAFTQVRGWFGGGFGWFGCVGGLGVGAARPALVLGGLGGPERGCRR